MRNASGWLTRLEMVVQRVDRDARMPDAMGESYCVQYYVEGKDEVGGTAQISAIGAMHKEEFGNTESDTGGTA